MSRTFRPMANVINVTFPEKVSPLYRRIIKTCPDSLTVAAYARTLLQSALDATCAPVRKGRK